VRPLLYSLFFSYENANIKKGALIVEFPLTIWLEWLLWNIITPLLFSQIPLLNYLLNYGTSTMLKNGTPSLPSGSVFNIA
jgi:hypothetical protein